MTKLPWTGLLLLLAMLLAACGARNTVILLPDPDGRVGKVEVATRTGTQILSQAGQMTRVTSQSQSPSQATLADKDFITRTFGAALEAAPAPPEKFILYFMHGTTELLPESTDLLPAIHAAIMRRSATDISIDGHSDRTGSRELNLDLSLRRAMCISNYLKSRGVNPTYLHVESHGDGLPLIPTPDKVAEPRNRRVEVIVR